MTISGFVAYVKQLWKNKPDTSTPLSAARLAHMENGIKGNSDAIEKIAAAVISQISNDPDKIASMAALYSVNQKVAALNSDLAAQGWTSLPLSGSWAAGSYVYYRNQAGNKQVKVHAGPLNAPIGTYNAAFTLPDTMRPTKGIYGSCITSNGAQMMYYIAADGIFKIKSLGQALSNITVVAQLDF